jgi:acyl-CoA-binding protein
MTILKYSDSTESKIIRIFSDKPLSPYEIKKVSDMLEKRMLRAKVIKRSCTRSAKVRRNPVHPPAVYDLSGIEVVLESIKGRTKEDLKKKYDDLSEIEMALESIKGRTKEDLKKKYAWVKQNA